MTSSMLRRQLKNLVQNFSEAEVKVREATSNDPWGPSSSQMADISDLTYNVVACNEIMIMLWKRLKDDKNWRHIYKSLTLLENLLKTGSDRVLNTMKDNVYIVKALTEFRFQDKDGKDQGVNVREKAKVVLVLMEDDEKLKEERESALKTRDKISKSATASSDDPNDPKDPNYKPVYVPGATGLPSLANIPSVADLAASFEAKKQEKLRLEAQKKEEERRSKMTKEELEWEDAAKAGKVADAFGGADEPSEEDAWASTPPTASDPWGATAAPTDTASTSDPWGDGGASTTTDTMNSDPWGAPSNGTDNGAAADESNKSPASFLGAGASLVNMDSLLSSEPKQPPLNVFAKQQSKDG
ncbi:epsin-1-like [Salvelinus namaycush]|uniref:Epsin-1-like n=1 Tax=Salvelinus namaycush TaxID=8040 RepID=A0A8U0PD72_SALNM|nr:epsin-1-like [Salvelinus namaycush]